MTQPVYYRVTMQKKPYNLSDAPYFLANNAEEVEWTTIQEDAARYTSRREAEGDARAVHGFVVLADVNPSEYNAL